MKARLSALLVCFTFILLLTTKSFPQGQGLPKTFNVAVYEGTYPDIMNVYGTNLAGAADHWQNFGLPAGRRATLVFDPVYYLQHNPDLAATFGATGYAAAAQHFTTTGLPVEGRRGSLEFDVKYYLAHNPDLATAFGTNYSAATDHFLGQGLPNEGRRGSADFNVQDYISNHPDVATGYGATDYTDAILHWLRRGKAQGRQGFGVRPAPVECGDGHTTEFLTVPVAAPPALPSVTVAHSGVFVANGSVFYVNPPAGFAAQLTAVASSPAQGQYTVTGGVYTFSLADAEAPIQINYTLTPIPAGYSRIFFDLHTVGGNGTMSTPFNASVMDITLRHISEQTGTVPNAENGGGQPYDHHNLIVCLNDTGVFPTLGVYDWFINNGHSSGTQNNKNPDDPVTGYPAGFTINKNWHIHGKGMAATTLRLSDYMHTPFTQWGLPAGAGVGVILGSHDDDVGGVEVSDLTLDDNYSGIKGSALINLWGIFLRGNAGGNNIHNINVLNPSGETGIEVFPVLIQAASNASPLQNTNNQIKYVLMSGIPPAGMCTGITLNRAQAEVAYNVVNSWGFGGFGKCNGFGGFDMDSSWFHDNFALNNTPAGFLSDTSPNRNIVVEFNTIINPQNQGILVGGGSIYDYYTIQYNNIQLAANGTAGIWFNGNVVGATVTRNNITTTVSPSGAKGISFGISTTGNTGNVFQYNQIASAFGNASVPSGNCVFSNWNQGGVQLSNLSNTQGSPCATPVQPHATMQTDGNFVIYGPAGSPLWSTATSGSGGAIIRMQDDGNLVIYAQVWQAGTAATPAPGPFTPQTCSIGTLLHSPESMLPNQCITSPQGQYMLWMAPTGPLFIYDLAHGVGTWGATGTGNNSGATATLQSDGNFVVYSAAGTALWNSGTNGTNATLLNMEDNGQIILYRPVWQSGALQAWGQTPISHPTCDVGTGTGWTGVLNPGQCFVSPNGHFELLLQSDGGLTIYDRSVSPPQPVWSR